MPKAAITLDEHQQAEIQMIVVDGDAGEALRFLKEVVWGQIQTLRRKGLRGPMQEAGR